MKKTAKKVKKKWFSPGKETGWTKKQKAKTRRAKLLASTDKRMTMHNRNVRAGRKIMALHNVTKDAQTKAVARTDALYFFSEAKKKGE